MPEFRIQSSEPAHFKSALPATAALRASWPKDHPGVQWAEASKEQASGPLRLDFTGDQEGFERYPEKTMLPAMMLCRFARSLADLPLLAGTEQQEVARMKEPEHFLHTEHVLHVAIKLAFTTGVKVRIVRAVPSERTPDIEVPEEKFAIECRARSSAPPAARLRSDFEHASMKFSMCLSADESRDWVGVLATDLGAVGSPEIPNIGRPLPRLEDLETDIDNYVVHDNVATVLLTASSLRITNNGTSKNFLAAADLSAWRSRERRRTPRSIRRAFYELDQHISRPARPDGNGPRRI